MPKKSFDKLMSFLQWLDEKLLLLVSAFLIAFIPLYPKLPLFDAIPGYLVRVRLEDFFVLAACLIWLVQFWRKKVTIDRKFAFLIGGYILFGFLSLLSAIFLIKTVPLETVHVMKSALHLFRYIEYFSLFFIVFSAVKTKKDVKILLAAFLATLLAVSVYGYGQKNFYWPVYSTMNREFSKGLRLYLTEHARVQSTFGGHYDAAAYLVILLPVVYALMSKATSRKLRFCLFLTYLAGLWLLVLTASRTSFVAFVVAVGIILLFLASLEKSWLKRFLNLFSNGVKFLVVILVMMLFFGDDMYERLMQVVDSYPKLHDAYHDANYRRIKAISWVLEKTGIKEPEKPENSISLDEMIALENKVLVNSDTRPTTDKPSDVYVDVPDIVEVASKSADGSDIIAKVERDRTWSINALKYGLSMGIRLDTLWPNAINGFLKNPILGSGYGTLNKEGAYHFLEADSTDNNFLRTLGETGLAGVITFYGVILLAIKKAIKATRSSEMSVKLLAIGFITASIGLLINAIYIDVFAASKVAFTYWAITGLTIAFFDLEMKEKIDQPKTKKKTK
ncbi:MAG: O-antigen ligase family protein [Patescibacteria group bacterium]